MAKITDLPIAAAPFGNEHVPLVQDGETVQMPIGLITSAADTLQVVGSSTSENYLFDVWTRELAPGSNRYVHTRLRLETGDRLECWRVIGCWIAQRTGADSYADLHQIIGAPPANMAPLELRALETGEAEAMGTLNDQGANVLVFSADGREGTAIVGFSGRFRRFEVPQRSPLFRPSGDLIVAVQRSRHVFTPQGFAYEFEFEVIEPFSLSSLRIGATPILTTDGATALFNKVRRGPRWHIEHDLTAPVALAADQSSVFSYSGPLGIGVETAVALGSDWPGPHASAWIEADGAAVFDWHAAPYSPALPAGTHVRGRVDWRFSYRTEA